MPGHKEKGKFNNLYGNYRIGEGTTIGSFCDIGGEIGKNCKIQSYVFIPPSVYIQDDCFIGPRVTFTNDKYPPSGREKWIPTLVMDGARIGAGVTILPGLTIGKGAFIGAGSLVTEPIPAGEMWYGSPAKFVKKYESLSNRK